MWENQHEWEVQKATMEFLFFLVKPHGLTEGEGVVLHAEKESKNWVWWRERERERERSERTGENEKIKTWESVLFFWLKTWESVDVELVSCITAVYIISLTSKWNPHVYYCCLSPPLSLKFPRKGIWKPLGKLSLCGLLLWARFLLLKI